MDHNVFCTELRNLGVHNVLITWIGSFLTNISRSVKISSAISGHVVPRGGIPQGTKLAPLLFAVLVNRPIRLTQFCTQFKSLGVKDLCMLHLHDNVAFIWKYLEQNVLFPKDLNWVQH